jgi:hypothetical protein
MGFLDKILGRKQPAPPSPPSEHAVLVLFSYGSTDLSRLFALEERLEQVTCPPKADPSAMRVPTGPDWALETLDETDTTHP